MNSKNGLDIDEIKSEVSYPSTLSTKTRSFRYCHMINYYRR